MLLLDVSFSLHVNLSEYWYFHCLFSVCVWFVFIVSSYCDLLVYCDNFICFLSYYVVLLWLLRTKCYQGNMLTLIGAFCAVIRVMKYTANIKTEKLKNNLY